MPSTGLTQMTATPVMLVAAAFALTSPRTPLRTDPAAR